MTDTVEWVWVPDRRWAPAQNSYCRYPKCRDERGSRVPAVAMLKRHRRTVYDAFGWSWYPYCEKHMYGQKIENGIVMCAVRPDSQAAKRGYCE
jgi:hypothetical protein